MAQIETVAQINLTRGRVFVPPAAPLCLIHCSHRGVHQDELYFGKQTLPFGGGVASSDGSLGGASCTRPPPSCPGMSRGNIMPVGQRCALSPCGSLELSENTEGEGRRNRHPDVRGRGFSSLKGSWPASPP